MFKEQCNWSEKSSGRRVLPSQTDHIVPVYWHSHLKPWEICKHCIISISNLDFLIWMNFCPWVGLLFSIWYADMVVSDLDSEHHRKTLLQEGKKCQLISYLKINTKDIFSVLFWNPFLKSLNLSPRWMPSLVNMQGEFLNTSRSQGDLVPNLKSKLAGTQEEREDM